MSAQLTRHPNGPYYPPRSDKTAAGITDQFGGGEQKRNWTRMQQGSGPNRPSLRPDTDKEHHRWHVRDVEGPRGGRGTFGSISQFPPHDVRPTWDDREQSKLLHSLLLSLGVFDTADGLKMRLAVLLSLELVLNEWAESIRSSPLEHGKVGDNKKKKCHSHVAVVSFGSYRLGVHRPDGDIDALALCPPHCTRDDFFGPLVQRLNDDSRVLDLQAIPG